MWLLDEHKYQQINKILIEAAGVLNEHEQECVRGANKIVNWLIQVRDANEQT